MCFRKAQPLSWRVTARRCGARRTAAALSPELVALEATGGFETVVAAALAAAGLPVVVVNPAQVRHFAQALGQRAKTDPIDAAVIARFAQATQPGARLCRTRRPGCSPIWSPDGVRSST